MKIATVGAAVVLGTAYLVGYAALSHAIPHYLDEPNVSWAGGGWQWKKLCFLLALAVLLWMLGRLRGFVNDSTLQPLYGARLTRTYLGASNPARVGRKHNPVTSVIEGDDSAKHWGGSCKAFESGAPVHLVNVTVNETFEAKSGVQRTRRRGIGMAIGPAAVSLGVRHHVVFDDPLGTSQTAEVYPCDGSFRVFHYPASNATGRKGPFVGEALTAGEWTGISGAAFSTGVGSGTSLGQAFLAWFLNVRLGYWWDSGVKPGDRPGKSRWGVAAGRVFSRCLPVYSHLIDEMTGRFLGTGRRMWNLSDGGHFENMGAYELVRRRVPVMLVVDAEADPEGVCTGLANLVRKARTDFDAEIRFMTEAEIRTLVEGCGNRLCGDVKRRLLEHFGNIEAVRAGARTDGGGKGNAGDGEGGTKGRANARAAMATVRYEDADDGQSLLVYLKPVVAGDEPLDIAEYREKHPEFPQQTTRDQFFDEEQWEAYRLLGELVAKRVFTVDGNPFGPFRELRRRLC